MGTKEVNSLFFPKLIFLTVNHFSFLSVSVLFGDPGYVSAWGAGKVETTGKILAMINDNCSHVMRFQSRPTNWLLLTIESPVAKWLEHRTRSRRVVGMGFNSHLGLGF